jgi:hypothetical protein
MGVRMKTFQTVLIDFLLAAVVYVYVWSLVSSLINHACLQWWKERENYRRRMDAKVEELIEDLNEFEQQS